MLIRINDLGEKNHAALAPNFRHRGQEKGDKASGGEGEEGPKEEEKSSLALPAGRSRAVAVWLDTCWNLGRICGRRVPSPWAQSGSRFFRIHIRIRV